MTNLKISGLTALSSVASSDLVEVVDVSDTTMAVTGTNKQVTVTDLATAITTVGALATDAEVAAAISALSATYQPLDSDLTAIAALATTSFGRGFLVLADAAAGRTALGLGTAAVADTGTGAANVPTITQADARYQPLDSDLTAIAALTTTSTGRSLLAAADAAAIRTIAGVGTIGTQASSSVSITGGSITGITDLAVADGGTGGSDAATARTNLGLVIGTNVQAYDVELAAIAAVTSAADRLPYFTGSGTATVATFTAAGRNLIDDADNTAQRTTLGLGTAATADSGAAAGNVLAVNTVNAKGDLLVATADNTIGVLTVGTNTHVLTADSAEATGVKWAAAAAGGSVATDTIFDAKGDLPVGTGADTAAKLTVGANGSAVFANSNSTTGLLWVPGGATPGFPIRINASAYVYPYGHTATSTATSGSTAQLTALYAIFVDRRLTLAGLGCTVTTLEAGATARLGIYSMTAWDPDALVADYGTVDCSTTGVKMASGSTVLDPGWYAMAHWTSNNTTVRFQSRNCPLYNLISGSGGSFTNGECFWAVASTDYSAGLPSNITTTLGNSVTARPIVFARFS